MTSRSRGNGQDVRFVNHALWSFEGGAATSSKLFMGNLITDATNTVNPSAPRAMKLVGYSLHALCIVDDVAGNWTMRIRKNESGSDSATFTFPLTTTPTKQSGAWSSDVVWDAAETYHVIADGPQKTVLALRLMIEWEPI